jgi:GT2 family glycosyltransferase
MKLAIVIVNFRTPDDTIHALESLVGEISAAPGARVIVVDNASGDDSVQRIGDVIEQRRWFWASLLPLEKNIGFGRANNAAVEQLTAPPQSPSAAEGLPRYILLLNPDTIVRPGALGAMMEFLDAHPRAGIVGSRLEDPDGAPQRSAFRFPSVWSELECGLQLGIMTRLLHRWVSAPPPRDQPHLTDWVAGASMMIRREVIENVSLFDPDFFMYYEEVDFCLRARNAGWECWYLPQARIVHLVGRASGITVQRPQPRPRPGYWFESRRLFFLKNLGTLRALAADAAFALGFAAWRLRRRIQRKPDLDPPGMLWDFLRHSTLVRGPRITPPPQSRAPAPA